MPTSFYVGSRPPRVISYVQANAEKENMPGSYETTSDCDADDLHAAVLSVLEFASTSTPLVEAFRTIIDGYHTRHGCQCRDLLPKDADSYHS